METIELADGRTIQVEAIDGMVWLGESGSELFMTGYETTTLIAALQRALDDATGRTGQDWYTVTLRDETNDEGEADTTYALIAPDFDTAQGIAKVAHREAGFERAYYVAGKSFKGRPTTGGYIYNTLMQDGNEWRVVGTSVAA